MTEDNQNTAPLPEASTWYLKIDDGSVFGPVEAETLRLWAQQGRVAPGNTISINQADWYPAEEYEDLDMRWLVGLSNGTTYGPINIRALEELINSGTVTPDAALEDARTGEKSTPREKRDEIFFGGVVPPEFDVEPTEEKEGQAGISPEVGDDVGHAARELASAIAEDEAGGATLDHASLDEKISRFESTLKRTMTLLRAHQRELEREREHNQEIREELEKREDELKSAREELAEMREKHTQGQEKSAETTRILAEREQAIRSSADTIETLRKRLEEEQDKVRNLSEESTKRESDAAELLEQEKTRQKELTDQLAATREELSQKSDELTTLQGQVEETKQLSEGEAQRAQVLESEISTLRDQLAGESASRAELSETLKSKESELENLRQDTEKTAGSLKALKDELAATKGKAEKLDGELEAARQAAVSQEEQSEERERALLEQVNSLKEAVQTASDTLETLKVDLRKAQEGALDAQKVRQSLDQERQRGKSLLEQNAALKKRLESRKEASAKQFEHAEKKIDELQREVEAFEQAEVVTPELVQGDDGPQGNPELSPLEDLEAQAQRELRAWQRSRKR